MNKALTYVIMGKDELTPVLRKAGKEGEATGGKLSSAMGAAGQAFAGLAVVIGGAVVKSLNDARNLNMAPLKQAALDAGIAWAGFKPKVDAAGQSMAKLGFTQSDVNKSLATLVTATGSSTASLAALAGAADYARFKHVGLADASAALTKAASGNTRALKDLGITTASLPAHFSTTGTEASRLGVIMDLLNPKIGGQAAAAANTLGGKMNVLKAETTNFSAQLGTALIPMLSSTMTVLTNVLTPIMRNKAAFVTLGVGVMAFAVYAKIAMTLFSDSVKSALVGSVVGIAILALTVAITELLLHWNTVWGAMKDAFNTFKNVMLTGLKALVDYFLWWAGMFIHTAASAFGWIPGLGGKLKSAATAFDNFRDSVNNSLDGLKSKTVSVSVAMTASANPYGGINAKSAAGGHIRGPGGPTSDTAGLFALSNGEYVVRASSVGKYGVGFMHAINAGRLAQGGAVGADLQTSLPSGAKVGSTIWNAVTKLVNSAVTAMQQGAGGWSAFAGLGSALSGSGGAYSASASVAQAFAKSILWAYGWGADQMAPLIRLWNQESGWNAYAVNGSSGAYGIPQSLGHGHPYDLGDYATQIRWGLAYISQRYGSPANAWGHEIGYNWYDQGGYLPKGLSLAYNGTGQPEPVGSAIGSGGNTYNITVNVGSTLASKQEIGRAVAEGLSVYEGKGGTVPYAKR